METFSFDQFGPWLVEVMTSFAEAGTQILLILVVAVIAKRFIRLGLTHLETLLIHRGKESEEVPGSTEKRVKTLTGLLRTICLVIIWSVAIIMSFGQIGIDITPIIASAGILGLAVGFGAQNLVRDVISGFFIILENQVRVGDVAIVNGTGGLVETISFRTITLRDLAGVVHVFPNGTITTLSNMTKGWSGYVLDIGVAYKENTDHVIEVMKEVGEGMRNDPEYRSQILEPIEIFGVDQFGASEVVIKARLKTQPIKQWAVGREYRRRLKKAFDERGIEIPFPHQTLYMGEASLPFRIQADSTLADAPIKA